MEQAGWRAGRENAAAAATALQLPAPPVLAPIAKVQLAPVPTAVPHASTAAVQTGNNLPAYAHAHPAGADAMVVATDVAVSKPCVAAAAAAAAPAAGYTHFPAPLKKAADATGGQPPPPLESAAHGQPLPPPVEEPAPVAATATAEQLSPPLPLLNMLALRQMFFDQSTEPAPLRRRLEELWELRRCRVFPDKGALWDLMLGHLRRYLHMLEQQQQGGPEGTGDGQAQAEDQEGAGQQQEWQQQQQAAIGAALDAAALACDLCREPTSGGQLRRMQRMGQPEHVAVCGACAKHQLGLLMPLTPTWQPDVEAWGAIQQALVVRQQALQRGASGKERAVAIVRPSSAASTGSHRGRARFQGTSRAWLKELTKGNLDPTNGPKPRVYLPFGVYWFWVDRLLGQGAEVGCPRLLRLTLAEPISSGSATAAAAGDAAWGAATASSAGAGSTAAAAMPAWDIRLLHTDDGMQLQPSALRPMLEHLGARVGSRLLIELQEEHCSTERLQASVRLIGSDDPLPDLPGDPVTAPRSAVAAAGLAGSKKRKGMHMRHPVGSGGGGGGAGDEFYYGWDDAWDEAEDDDTTLQAISVQSLDGPSGAGRSKRSGAGGRLASILRRELPQLDDSEDGNFKEERAQDGSEGMEVDDSGELPFEPRRTPSLDAAAALAAELAPDVAVLGAHPPPPGTAHKWGVYAKCAGHRKAWYGRLDRQRAAVAADLVSVWQQQQQQQEQQVQRHAANAAHRPGRQLSLWELLALERGEEVDACPASSSSSDASIRDEVQAMQAAAAAFMTTAGSGGLSPHERGDIGGGSGEGEGMHVQAGRCGAAEAAAVPAVLNLPGARYQEDAELMGQLRQVRSTQQMVTFLSAVVPQDLLPRQRGAALLHARSQEQQQILEAATTTTAAPQQPMSRPLPQVEVEEGQGQGQLAQQQQQQARRKRKRSHATGQPEGRATGRPPLPPPLQQPPGDGSGRRRVGVVWYADERRWAAAAAGRDTRGLLVPLRVESLPAPEQAEVARDLLALWSWQAQGGLLPSQQQQQVLPFEDAAGGGGDEAAEGGLDRQGSTATAVAGPPVPPLNHPLEFYAKWIPDLQQLGAREVEPYVQVVAEEVSSELPPPEPASSPTATRPSPSGPAVVPRPPAAAAAPAVKAVKVAAAAAAPSTTPGVGRRRKAATAAAPASAAPASALDLLNMLASAASATAVEEPAEAPARILPAPAAAGAAATKAGRSQAPASGEWQAPLKQEGQDAFLQSPRLQHHLSGAGEQEYAGAVQPAPEVAATAAPASQLLPAVAGDGGSGSLLGAASSGGRAGPSATLAERAAQAAQRKVQQALAAFETCSTDSADSMLRPLRLLALASKGGQTLRDVVQHWGSYSTAQQQEVFEAALITSNEGGWEQLEEQVRLALETG